jgi:hypothetical protein
LQTGKPRFKAVIEGANLFFSEQARLHLEKNGVIVIKDASANKGGVTSSSFEVLSALALSDEAFMRYVFYFLFFIFSHPSAATCVCGKTGRFRRFAKSTWRR